MLLCVGFLSAGISVSADEDQSVVYINLNMDFSNAVSSGTEIEQSILTALSAGGATLATFRVELIKTYPRPFLI